MRGADNMQYKELVEAYLKLDEQHTQERKTLERKQKLQMDELLIKQHEAKKEIKLSSFFHVNDCIALSEVEYMPTVELTLLAVADDYMVGFSSKILETRLITWDDLIEAKKVYRNGEELWI